MDAKIIPYCSACMGDLQIMRRGAWRVLLLWAKENASYLFYHTPWVQIWVVLPLEKIRIFLNSTRMPNASLFDVHAGKGYNRCIRLKESFCLKTLNFLIWRWDKGFWDGHVLSFRWPSNAYKRPCTLGIRGIPIYFPISSPCFPFFLITHHSFRTRLWYLRQSLIRFRQGWGRS